MFFERGVWIDEAIGFDGGGVGREQVTELILEPGHGDPDGGLGLALVVGFGQRRRFEGALNLVDGVEVLMDLVAIAAVEDGSVSRLFRRRRVPTENNVFS